MSQGYPVYIGAWTNWSRGRVLGATVTLTRRDAALAIAFTSTFIAFVGTRVWRLLCFVLHRNYSATGPQNTSYHQLQAILRNASAPEDGIRLFMKLLSAKHWRTKRQHRLLFSTTFGIILFVAFAVLGGFSSSIALTNNEVLIQSAACGFTYTTLDQFFDYISYHSRQFNNAANYVQQCYSEADNDLVCGSFSTDRIIGAININATCPFDSKICLNQQGNILIDSGFINSHTHLGLNAPPRERPLWRNVLHCAPLITAGFTSVDIESQTNDVLFHYGNKTTVSGTHDYMFRIQGLDSQYRSTLSKDESFTDFNYELNVAKSPVKNGTIYLEAADFIPIDLLSRADADITLVFLSGNGVGFSEYTDDVWYNVSAAAVDVSFNTEGGSEYLQVFLPQAPASPLACVTRAA